MNSYNKDKNPYNNVRAKVLPFIYIEEIFYLNIQEPVSNNIQEPVSNNIQEPVSNPSSFYVKSLLTF